MGMENLQEADNQKNAILGIDKKELTKVIQREMLSCSI